MSLSDEQKKIAEGLTDELGIILTGGESLSTFVMDADWALGKLLELEAKEEADAVAFFETQHGPDWRKKTVEVTPIGHFDDTGDIEPLATALETGASRELQAWIAQALRRNAFAGRKSKMRRIKEMGPLYDAAEENLPRIERFLRERGMRRGAKLYAMKLSAIIHRVKFDDIERYLKRGRDDPKRVRL